MGTVHKAHRHTTTGKPPARQPKGSTPHKAQSTFTKGEMDKFALSFWGEARNADANGNRNLTPAEVDGYTTRSKAVRADMKKILQGAMAQDGRTYAENTGDLYTYAKSLLVELRTAADDKGNKDHKLSTRELKGVSPEAKALFEMNKALINGKA